ncbi:MAG: hypothetical protein Q4B59_03195 [Lachnospiraceae bacterium]|nr:hypothetical protein [Lachnospiraceae bacterium]
MHLEESLCALRTLARSNEALRQALLDTRTQTDPLLSFCRLAQENGIDISLIDLVCAGEEAYAAMRRSTNGGGENSPLLDGEDDYYELFLASL